MQIVPVVFALSVSISAYAAEIPFPSSTVRLKLDPAPATHKIDQIGRLVVVPVPGVAYQLKLGPTGTRPSDAPPFDAKAFVRELAQRSGRELTTVPDQIYLSFSEPIKVRIRDGYRVHEVSGVQAMRGHYVMFTALVSEEFVPANDVSHYLGPALQNVLAAIAE